MFPYTLKFEASCMFDAFFSALVFPQLQSFIFFLLNSHHSFLYLITVMLFTIAGIFFRLSLLYRLSLSFSSNEIPLNSSIIYSPCPLSIHDTITRKFKLQAYMYPSTAVFFFSYKLSLKIALNSMLSMCLIVNAAPLSFDRCDP